MSSARLRRWPRGAALAVLAASAAAAGCARERASPGTAASAQPAQTSAPAAATAPVGGAAAAAANTPAVGAAPAPAGPAPPATPVGAAAPGVPAPTAALAGAPAAPELTLEQMQRRSPSTALVETFNAACGEPARNAVRRAARRLDFAPVAAPGAPRDGPGKAAAALPQDGEAWRGPEEVGGAVLVWDEAASTCELRAEGVNLLLVEAAFSRLPQALEEEGASVARLAPPAVPAGRVRTRQMLLVQPGASSRPERARVLRLGHHLGQVGEGPGGGDTVTLSARAVSATPR